MNNSDQTIIKKSIHYVWYFIMFFAFNGCVENQLSNLSVDDIKQIKKINSDYTKGWLENDPEKVLGLYTDSATIIPSGLLPIQGKKAITEFWFPDDGSTTVIHSYDLEIQDIAGSSNLAYTYEHGKLSFTYEKDDYKLERKSESYAVTIYIKAESGDWKITKRIWTDMNN